jgi:hypothetical protein
MYSQVSKSILDTFPNNAWSPLQVSFALECAILKVQENQKSEGTETKGDTCLWAMLVLLICCPHPKVY